MISKLITAAVVGALLFDVRNCSDIRKNKEGIAELLEETAVKTMGSEQNAAQFGGWTIDNTRTNKAAISILENKRPDWINLGCVAHCTALAIKDFCKVVKTGGCTSTTFGCKWLKEVNDEANEAANFINDSGNAKCQQRFQVEVYGRKLAVDVSVPTRSATNLFVMVGIQQSKAALVQAVSSQEWLNLDGKATQGNAHSSQTVSQYSLPRKGLTHSVTAGVGMVVERACSHKPLSMCAGEGVCG
jgi:hypothetical protein